ncbi:sensor histidine kinase [Flagellimonas pelagia]|uniref:Sensor histidine kinase n=1 Tax=Flagellimonas pelagia TaxID=2306998 RepID=A0A3A1NIH3_9FLAO|nr:histidine kinase [Allomuricauda maritima]RIV42143.1 sensor histidine kinase [Allomuricauda maritima]TXJ91031.1 sensor histidine kinase [Allomuricauda maritima]
MGANKSNTGISLYWKCQIVCWGVVSLLWLYIALDRDHFTVPHAIVNYVLDVSVCIGLTHAYRAIALRSGWNQLGIKQLLKRIIPSILILAVLFMQLMNLKTSAYIYLVHHNNTFEDNVWIWNPVLITGLRHMAIWVLAYHAYHFYQREVKTTKANAQLSVIAKQTQLDNLAAQLNPHFLFNSLNSIKALVIENPKSARRAIDLLSDLLRSSLYEKEHTTISIAEEMALVKDYVELEKLRFEERLNIQFNVDQTLEHFKIPPLSIQLLVENAIKHGIDKQLEGGTVAISVQKENDHVVITVKNPGNLSKDDHIGVGLKNLKQRLLLQYEGKADFKMESPSENDVVATLMIPIEK